MGEYAKFVDEEVKIGTCENMYYLRADQAHMVTALPGNVDPIKNAKDIRFRFPFPDEDGIAPGGNFEHFERGVYLHEIKPPAEGVGHESVQFTAPQGYLVSLPCPESAETVPGVHRNGFRGTVAIVQQRLVEGKLVLIAKCGGCDAKFRLATLDDARPYIEACRDRARHEGRQEQLRTERTGEPAPNAAGSARFWDEVAKRIELGYTAPELVAKGLFPRKAPKRAPRKGV